MPFGAKTKEELEGLTEGFRSFKKRFDRGLAVQSGWSIASVEMQLNRLLDHSGEHLLSCAQKFDLCAVVIQAEDQTLRKLRPHSPKVQRGHAGCMEGTRVDILGVIRDWIDDPTAPNVFWLHGHPGTGKSAIATTVGSSLLASGRLGSLFFFKREDFASQSPAALWCSIAYDLAQEYPSIRSIVVQKLTQREIDPAVTDDADMFEDLIAVPLRAATSIAPGRYPVVVIDALDECGGLDESRSFQRKVLRGISKWKTLPSQFKILVTSRNEGNLESVLGGSRSRVLEVGTSVTLQSSLDIRAYFEHEFNIILEEFTTIARPWPTDAELKMLTQAAAGLFIWAKTVIKLVSTHQPKKSLDRVLETIRGVRMRGDMDHLAQLYNGLLQSKFRGDEDVAAFRLISGGLITARTPLSANELKYLLPNLTQTDIEFMCNGLKSVLDTFSGLRFVHQSFVDFLLNLGPDSQFHFNRGVQEERFASSCFQLMQTELKFNIAEIETSHVPNTAIVGLSSKVPDHLYYACRFWSDHLVNSAPNGSMEESVNEFLEKQFLFWLEVLSIRDSIGVASEALEKLVTWIPVSGLHLVRTISRSDSDNRGRTTI